MYGTGRPPLELEVNGIRGLDVVAAQPKQAVNNSWFCRNGNVKAGQNWQLKINKAKHNYQTVYGPSQPLASL